MFIDYVQAQQNERSKEKNNKKSDFFPFCLKRYSYLELC